jgi:hypothetical protein
MDPDASWELMLTAYQESNWDEAVEHAEAILAWLRCGGFAPTVTVGLNKDGLLFDFDHDWVNRTTADAVARAIRVESRRYQANLKR